MSFLVFLAGKEVDKPIQILFKINLQHSTETTHIIIFHSDSYWSWESEAFKITLLCIYSVVFFCLIAVVI